jgi:hypothetical protein
MTSETAQTHNSTPLDFSLKYAHISVSQKKLICFQLMVRAVLGRIKSCPERGFESPQYTVPAPPPGGSSQGRRSSGAPEYFFKHCAFFQDYLQCSRFGAGFGSISFWASGIRILQSSGKKSKKTLDFYCFMTSLWLFICDNVDVPQKLRKTFFVGILKVTDEKSRIQIRIRSRIRV